MVDDKNPIIVEQVFKVPVSRTWKAITKVTEMRHWFFTDIPDFKAEVGFYTEFKRESCITGWNYFIKQNLRELFG